MDTSQVEVISCSQMFMSASNVLVLTLYIMHVSMGLSFGQHHVDAFGVVGISEQARNRIHMNWRSSPELATTQANPSTTSREIEMAQRRNRISELFINSTPSNNNPHRLQINKQYDNNKNAFDQLYNTISFDDSPEFEPEIVTSNHQSATYELPPISASTGVINEKPRNYNQYLKLNHNDHQYNHNQQHKQPHGSKHNHKQHYIKYSPNIFANNHNLNYIYSFLTNKPLPNAPPPTTPPGSLKNTQPLGSAIGSHGLAVNSQQAPYQQHYMSASSALSVALTNLHQTIAHQQLTTIRSQNLTWPDAVVSSTVAPSKFDDSHAYNVNGTGDSPLPSPVLPPPPPPPRPSWPNCGRPQVVYREPRIVGGNSTYEGEFPWAVSIQRHGNHHCGGVIVSRRWILTAAHCVRSQLVTNLAVRTGGHTLSRSANSLSDHLDKDYQIEQIVMHDDFSRYDNLTASQMKSSANTNNADIALLKLRHEIQLNDLAWPVCFPPPDAGNFSGHDATVIGWGKLSEKSEEFSNELQKVKLTIIDNKVCQNWFRQAGREMPIDDRIICAGFKSGGKDACHGDSGGPLLSRINGQYSVVGVVSTGIGCARPLLPGLYSRVSSYLNWIERHISI